MITVFGSINVDMVMQVDALPAPGETVLCPEYLIVPGGKGANQAIAAARAGAPVQMIGTVGTDTFAETALGSLRDSGVDVSAVASTDRPTCCATVWVDNRGENSIVVASGANLDTTARQLSTIEFGAQDWLVLQMEIPLAENWAAVREAKMQGARVILSVAPAAPVPEEVLADVDVLLVNEIEGQAVATAIGLPPSDPKRLLADLSQRFSLTAIMTLGKQGAIMIGPAGGFEAPALPITTTDTTGAGDAFAGIMAAALDADASLENAVRRASVGAALACKTMGAQTSLPYRADIDSALPNLAPLRPLD
jgi:ribokinase